MYEPENLRLKLENEIEQFLKNSRDYEYNFKIILAANGIDPNLETKLAFFTGLLYGAIFPSPERWSTEDWAKLTECMRNRCCELRLILVRSSIELP